MVYLEVSKQFERVCTECVQRGGPPQECVWKFTGSEEARKEAAERRAAAMVCNHESDDDNICDDHLLSCVSKWRRKKRLSQLRRLLSRQCQVLQRSPLVKTTGLLILAIAMTHRLGNVVYMSH